MVEPAGRIGFKAGDEPTDPRFIDLFLWCVAAAEADVFEGALPFKSTAPSFDARVLLLELTPSLPRFMILAGVTGVMVGGGFSADILGIDVWFIVGAAGGGIAKSTGEGESPTISLLTMLPFLDRVDRRRGVELVEREPRGFVVLLVIMVELALLKGRMAGDCFFRDGFEDDSSPLEDAVRLLEED